MQPIMNSYRLLNVLAPLAISGNRSRLLKTLSETNYSKFYLQEGMPQKPTTPYPIIIVYPHFHDIGGRLVLAAPIPILTS